MALRYIDLSLYNTVNSFHYSIFRYLFLFWISLKYSFIPFSMYLEREISVKPMGQLMWSIWDFHCPTLTIFSYVDLRLHTYMYPGKKSELHITIQNFTLHHFIWFLSYDMKKVGLCVLATYAMPWFFSSGCWSRLRYADGKNVGPQSPSRIGDSLHHRAVTTALICIGYILALEYFSTGIFQNLGHSNLET